MVKSRYLRAKLLLLLVAATTLGPAAGLFLECRQIPIDCLMTDVPWYQVACKSSCVKNGYHAAVCTADATCKAFMKKYRCDCYQYGKHMSTFEITI